MVPPLVPDRAWPDRPDHAVATSHHYDLRLHLDGTMFSWAIPRGFDPPYDKPRLAIETFPHGKSYALYEGLATHGKSHAGIWDVGEYEVSRETVLRARNHN